MNIQTGPKNVILIYPSNFGNLLGSFALALPWPCFSLATEVKRRLLASCENRESARLLFISVS